MLTNPETIPHISYTYAKQQMTTFALFPFGKEETVTRHDKPGKTKSMTLLERRRLMQNAGSPQNKIKTYTYASHAEQLFTHATQAKTSMRGEGETYPSFSSTPRHVTTANLTKPPGQLPSTDLTHRITRPPRGMHITATRLARANRTARRCFSDVANTIIRSIGWRSGTLCRCASTRRGSRCGADSRDVA